MSSESRRILRAGLFLAAIWLAVCVVALKLGSVMDLDLDGILSLRLPRIILATAVGAGLAVAGLVLQVLFSNPLCEPYTLGISSAAAFGSVVGVSLGLDTTESGLALTGFAGSLVAAAVLLIAARRSRGTGPTFILLSGVMLGLVASSLVAVWMALADPNGISGALHWLLGELSRARMKGALTVLAGVLSLILLIFARRRQLDALLLGREGAQTVGVDVLRLERRLLILTSVLVGLCVSAAGAIGFVGLIVPHLVRSVVGSLHGRLIPFAAVTGATCVVLGDLLGRTVAAPTEIPVGVVTALVGAPVFVWILARNARTRGGL